MRWKTAKNHLGQNQGVVSHLYHKERLCFPQGPSSIRLVSEDDALLGTVALPEMDEEVEQMLKQAGLPLAPIMIYGDDVSHVVTEDTGLALGRALRGIAVERMEHIGIHGAGSNISSAHDVVDKPIRVGVSMEGRKFWKYVPFDQTYVDFRRSFLVGHTLPNGLFSEDLDDFVDGFAGGLHASVMVHIARAIDPVHGWPLLFRALGEATAELLSPNPARRGLIAGVKATLA